MSGRAALEPPRAGGLGATAGSDGSDRDHPGPISAVDQLRAAAADGRLDQPGHGRTAERFERLAAVARRSLGAGRLFEAHADGQTILLEAGWDEPEALGLLGVWASEGPGPPVSMVGTRSGPALQGTKHFCSGAPVLDHALVTAHDGARGVRLVVVDLRGPGVSVGPTTWTGPGMRSALTRSVVLDGAPVVAVVGGPGWYLGRAGFWHGGIGVAASWFGGALGVLDAVRGGVDLDDHHGLAHLGEVEASTYSMRASLERAAAEIDRLPADAAAAHRRSLTVRRVVAQGCVAVLEHAAGALGPRAMAFDAEHAERIVDLDVYIRQDHGRRDSEQLGRLVVDAIDLRC